MDNEPSRQTDVTLLDRLREWMSLQSEVLVLSGALMVFSLAMQMTGRFVPEYLAVLGATSFVVGLFGTLEEILNAVYPYPGGALSDAFGSRGVLVSFGIVTTLGYGVWALAPRLGELTLGPLTVPTWVWVFVGLFFVLAWKELGLGATFALVKDTVPPNRLARGFASTEVFRRVGYLVGPLIASAVLSWYADFTAGFQLLLGLAVVICLLATVAQQRGYDVASDQLEPDSESADEPSDSSLVTVLEDFRALPAELKPLLVGDTLVRVGNGMVYVFFILVITRYHEVGWSVLGWDFPPAAFFGLLLGIEMTVALLILVPAARLGDAYGQKPVVGAGFLVYAIFPILLIAAPSNPYVMMGLFALSGLRFAGMPAHKALIVGPARADRGGATTGAYYLIRNTLRAPAPAVGGLLYGISPVLSFGLATVIGLTGTVLFLSFGEQYRPGS